MIQACILDMDGVIVDTEIIHCEAFRFFLNEHHVNFTEKFIQSLVGFSIEDNMKEIKSELFGDKPLNINAGIKRRNDIYLELLSSHNLTPLPGVLELISYCHNNQIKLALASSSEWRQIDTIMNRIVKNYRRQFDVIISGDDVKYKKPSPDIYLHAVEKLKLPAKSCLAFEDSAAGVESAVAAGVICFAVRNQYFDDIYLNKANRIINSVQEALDNNFWDIG